MGGIGAKVELIGLHKHFGDVVAIDNLNLKAEPGEFLTLLGPSGSGKSTTLRLIGGFEHPTAGTIRIDGQDVATVPPSGRPINTVFQQYALFPHMNVEENVGYGLARSGVGQKALRSRVHEAMEMVRMPGVETRRPDELSGGQQQRVALARALINRPRVLLLDEPLGALDLKLRQAMQRELRELNRDTGSTFVYVTHDQDEALTMSDRIAVMDNGHILQLGSPEEIYERPSSRFVAEFIGQSNILEGTILDVVEDGVLVRLHSGQIVGARKRDAMTSGDDVAVMVRPEKLRSAVGIDESLANRFTGRVTDIIYLGPRRQLHFVTESGEQLIVNADLTGDCSVTSMVTVTFSSEDAVCLPC